MLYTELQSLLMSLTKRNITNVELAHAIGRDKSNITYKINNNRVVTDKELKKVSDYFKIPIETLTTKFQTETKTQMTDRIEIPYWSQLPEELKNPKIVSVWFDREIIENDWKMSAEHLCVMPMIGDKMSNYWYPIKSGDMLIVDTAQKQIIGNGVYFATSRNNERYWIREMQILFNDSIEFKGYAPSGNTTKTLTLEQLKETDFRLIGKVIKNVSFRL